MAEAAGFFSVGPYAAGTWVFGVLCSDADLRDAIDDMFVDCRAEVDGAYDCFVAQHADSEDGRVFDLDGPVFMEMRNADASAVLSMLVTSVNHQALEHEPERLHLHAAAVRSGAAGVLISASRDTGKTTTVAHLLDAGCAYLTDEAVAISADDVRLRGLVKPLTLKPGGLLHFPHVPRVPIGVTRDAGHIGHVPASWLGEVQRSAVGCALVVILSRSSDPNSDVFVEDVHPSDAVVALMSETMDASRYGRDAVLALARLAASSRCVRVVAGDPASTARAILASAPHNPIEAHSVELVECAAPVAQSVVTVLIGKRAAVHDVAGGSIVALDEAATEVWLALGGVRRMEFDPDGPVLSGFIGQLRSLGLLVPNRPCSAAQ